MLTPLDLLPRSVHMQCFSVIEYVARLLLEHFVYLCFISEDDFPENIGSSPFARYEPSPVKTVVSCQFAKM